MGTEFLADTVSVDGIDFDYSANGISNRDNQGAHIDNVENAVVDNDVNNNVVDNNVVGSNVVNNNSLVNENTVNNDVVGNNVLNSNLVVNESTANNDVVENNGNNVVEISTSENSAIANNNSMEEPNYSPVSDSENIVDPGRSSLCASSLDSGDGNLVEPSSFALIPSGASDVVMSGLSTLQSAPTLRFPLMGIPWTVVLTSLRFRSANKRGSAKLRLPLRWLPIPWPRGLQVSFPVCLRASSLPLQSVVALLSVHDGPFSSTNGFVVNFN